MEGFLKFVFVVLLGFAIRSTLGGWMVMIVSGMIHHETIPQLPAYSFRASVFLAIGLTVLGSFFYQYQSKD